MANQHDRLLVQSQAGHAGPRRLDAEVVLVLDVDRLIRQLGHLDVVRTSSQKLASIFLINNRRVAVHNGVHVARGRVVVVRVDHRA